MDPNRQHGAEYVALAVAAYHVYRETTGRVLEASDLSRMNAILQDVAHALSNVAPIYSLNTSTGTYEQLEQVELLFGAFRRGATLLRTNNCERKDLAIRRSDMRSAIAIFRRAGIKFIDPK